VTEAERYLRKARESLASAKADARARRYNSAANRAYYAAFQAAVAALIFYRVRHADTEWQHRFVTEEFSGKLIRRRKEFGSSLRSVLPQLFELRITADYGLDDVPKRDATLSVSRANEVVAAVAKKIERSAIGETKSSYEAVMKAKQASKAPEQYVEDVKKKILENYPDVDFKVQQRGPRDFTLRVYGDYPEMGDVSRSLGDTTIDLLNDHDVWIVVLALERHLPDS
jgi:uncharacterized protein (UPF0332 family)